MIATEKIHMVDVVSQYERIKTEVDAGILDVVKSGWYIKGPVVEAFEKELAEYLGVKHVIGCANGTDAIQIAIMALGLKPGDEIITPNFTYIATVEVVALLGLKPVLVDVDPETFNIDPSLIEEKITDKTKAIIPVHLFGQVANMDEVMKVANAHNLYVIEDTAQAIGAAYTGADGQPKMAGTIGHVGTTSFYPSKNLGCMGDGGAVMTNDDETAHKLRMIANHGQQRRYYFDAVGVNSRLDAIQAAILRVKLRHLKEYEAARLQAADRYDELLKDVEEITRPARAEYSTHVFHQYTFKCNGIDRDALQAHLTEMEIPSSVFYPVPVTGQEAYKNFVGQGNYPISEQLSKTVLSIPMHTELSVDQLEYICNQIKTFINKS